MTIKQLTNIKANISVIEKYLYNLLNDNIASVKAYDQRDIAIKNAEDIVKTLKETVIEED